MRATARSTPIFSTISSVCRMPAVSRTTKGKPPILTISSITSRVVPGTSVTMALFSLTKRLSKLDLPTLGLPTMAVSIPSRSSLPVSAVASILATSSATAPSTWRIASGSISPTSSGKSMPASIAANKPTNSLRISLMAWDRPPSSCRTARRWPRSVLARIKSITASAWLKSKRPFRKARLVNSPGSARRAPSSSTRSSTPCKGIKPP